MSSTNFDYSSSTSFFLVPEMHPDIRQALASSRPDHLPTNFCDLVKECVISVDESSPLTTVPLDSHHPSLTIDELRRMYHASLVDDNALTAFLKQTRQALHHSVASAFEVLVEAIHVGVIVSKRTSGTNPLDSVISRWSQLHDCRICLLLSSLLQISSVFGATNCRTAEMGKHRNRKGAIY